MPPRAGSEKALNSSGTGVDRVKATSAAAAAGASPTKGMIRTASAAPGTAGLEKDPAKMKEFFQGLMEKSKPSRKPPTGAPAAASAPAPAPAAAT